MKFIREGNITPGVALAPPLLDEILSIIALRFEVVDTSIGIPMDERATIFKQFTQADDSASRRFWYTDLGLSIVQHPVMLMNGHIELDSAPARRRPCSTPKSF